MAKEGEIRCQIFVSDERKIGRAAVYSSVSVASDAVQLPAAPLMASTPQLSAVLYR